MENNAYPLYDVPWLVRDPNDFRMSEKRHQIEVRNQAVVDDYFVLRSRELRHMRHGNKWRKNTR